MALFSDPQALKIARYTAAYLLLVVCAIFGLLIIGWIRTNIMDLCLILKVDLDTIYLIIYPGSFFLYLPYVFLVAVLEPYVNTAAKKGRVLAAARKMLVIEGSIGLAAFLVNQVFIAMQLPQGF